MLRNLMSCIMHLKVMLSLIIDIWNCFKSEVVFFPVFPSLSVQNLFFPGRYLPVNTTVKTGYRPKPSNPAFWYTYIYIYKIWFEACCASRIVSHECWVTRGLIWYEIIFAEMRFLIMNIEWLWDCCIFAFGPLYVGNIASLDWNEFVAGTLKWKLSPTHCWQPLAPLGR